MTDEDQPLPRNVVAGWIRTVKCSPAAKLILLLVFDHAGPQEDGRWVAWAGMRTLAEEACFAEGANGMRTVRKHLADLEDAGIIEREERRRVNGSQTTSRIVLLVRADQTDRPDPGVRPPRTEESAPPGSDSPGHPKPHEKPHGSPTMKEAGPRDDEFPDDLPVDLLDVAIKAGKILKRTALTRRQPKEVTRAAVGHAVLTFPDRDHVVVARDVENWLLYGAGATKSCRDVVARFRQFLKSSEPRAAGPLAGNVMPMNGRSGRRMTQTEETFAMVDQAIAEGRFA